MAEAQRAAEDLGRIGIPNDSINIVAGNDASRRSEYQADAKHQEEGTGAAAASGASFGGGVGILAGLAALAIPGVGPIIAGGAMATVLTGLGIGAASGALVGAFRNMGVSHDEAHLYEEAVRRGNVFMAVTANDPMEDEVSTILRDHGARDVNEESEKWRKDGWTHPNTSDSQVRWHEMPTAAAAATPIRSYEYRPAASTRYNATEPGAGAETRYNTTEPGAGAEFRNPAVNVTPSSIAPKLDIDPIPNETTISPRADDQFPERTGPVHLSPDPAWIFGNRWASDPNYNGKGWTDVESSLRNSWEAMHAGPWDTFRDRVRRGYEGEEDSLAEPDLRERSGQRGY
jgi:uncharacterized membrane protein